ncbi:hypothetical protein D3C83_25410 [compost metagenome]
MPLQPLVRDAPFLQRAELEIFHQYVAFLHETGEDLLAGLRRHVERQRALVAVDAEKISRLAVHEGRSPGARVVARAGRFDLDHVGAHVAQHLPAQRPGQDAREIQHPQSC